MNVITLKVSCVQERVKMTEANVFLLDLSLLVVIVNLMKLVNQRDVIEVFVPQKKPLFVPTPMIVPVTKLVDVQEIFLVLDMVPVLPTHVIKPQRAILNVLSKNATLMPQLSSTTPVPMSIVDPNMSP